MNSNLSTFKSFLLIELDNLVEAIEQLVVASKEKYKKRGISQAVLCANTAFFEKEIWGISTFHNHLKDLKLPDITEEEEMAKVFKDLFADWVKSHDLPPALIPLVEIKVNKVLRYVRQEQDPPLK
ncbi:MAG: hypothetical protein GX147_01325 [Deltaproteobacteria bacterium]|nr:hypothetical protein [Deltaproteobacteria bacterium]